jgi:hypothetical protein
MDAPAPVPPLAGTAVVAPPGRGALRAVRRPFDSIDPAAWDACGAANPQSTPFSRWAFHRAWWDAYGANVHDQTTVFVPAGAPADAPPVAIVPLMHRHAVEPDDVILATHARHVGGALTPVAPGAKAVYFGASYHADYATILGAPAVFPSVAAALADAFATSAEPTDDHPEPWDVVDLRRLRQGDPSAAALEVAFRAKAGPAAWTVTREREDVCPVVTPGPEVDFEGFLGSLGRKERHEIRRKIRRAEAAGEVRLLDSTDPTTDLDAFVDLHQRRWGADGLFPPTPGGEQSRVFFGRLLELGTPAGFVRLVFVSVAGRRVAAGLCLEDGAASYFYNAGVDPDARELSPGVLLSGLIIRDAIEAGRRRFDFLRGDEAYKYEWGAVDEPITRLLVVRTP